MHKSIFKHHFLVKNNKLTSKSSKNRYLPLDITVDKAKRPLSLIER